MRGSVPAGPAAAGPVGGGAGSPRTRTPAAEIRPAISAPIAAAASSAQRGVWTRASSGPGAHTFPTCVA